MHTFRATRSAPIRLFTAIAATLALGLGGTLALSGCEDPRDDLYEEQYPQIDSEQPVDRVFHEDQQLFEDSHTEEEYFRGGDLDGPDIDRPAADEANPLMRE